MTETEMRWFRLYSEMLSDRKIRRAAKIAGVGKTMMVGAFVSLLCLANDSPKRGCLFITPEIPFSINDLADELEIEKDVYQKIDHALQEFGLIEWVDGVCMVAKWDRRQYASDSSTQRVRKWRNKQRNDTSQKIETLPERSGNQPESESESEADTESDTEAEADDSPGGSLDGDPLALAFEVCTGYLVGNPEQAVKTLNEMKALGIRPEDIQAAHRELVEKGMANYRGIRSILQPAKIAMDKRLARASPQKPAEESYGKRLLRELQEQERGNGRAN